MVTNAVEYAGKTREWAETGSRKIREWGEDAGDHAQETLGRAEEVLGQAWRTTNEIATRATILGERAVQDAETRDGLLLGAAVLAIGGAVFIAMRRNGEAIPLEQQASAFQNRTGGRPQIY
jgi:hypothetical protein